MILISNQTIGLWSIPLDDRSDYLCHLRQLTDSEFRIEVRIRIYDPDNPDPFGETIYPIKDDDPGQYCEDCWKR